MNELLNIQKYIKVIDKRVLYSFNYYRWLFQSEFSTFFILKILFWCTQLAYTCTCSYAYVHLCAYLWFHKVCLGLMKRSFKLMRYFFQRWDHIFCNAGFAVSTWVKTFIIMKNHILPYYLVTDKNFYIQHQGPLHKAFHLSKRLFLPKFFSLC